MCPPDRCSGLVYGSGFEGRTKLLAQLARGRTLFGNAPDTVAQIKDPSRFFPMLDSLGIAHPETRLEPPADVTGWLVKRSGGAGGSHVTPARPRHRARPGRYFQKLQSGRTLSVLFAADGHEARVIGINEQWTAALHSARLTAMAARSVAWCCPRPCKHGLRHCSVELVRSTGLVGLNGLDFLFDGNEPCVLEINPRPTATIDLYDADFDNGLLAFHLRACRGELPEIKQAGSLAGACNRLRPGGVARACPSALAGVVHRYSAGRQPGCGGCADLQRARDGRVKRDRPAIW